MSAPLVPRQDREDRRRLFDARSFQHPAKANLSVLDMLLREYTRPGELVLDPMAGTGSLFVGSVMGRRVLCGELEDWLRPILAANARRARAFGPAPLACQWDARRLPLADDSVDHIILSPPYADTFSDWHISSADLRADEPLEEAPPRLVEAEVVGRRGVMGAAYGDDRGRARGQRRNIGNLHYYEDFLRAMGAALVEWHRVLKPGGRLIQIVKDRIKGGRRLPIVNDLAALSVALGFTEPDRIEMQPRLTLYRQIHALQGREIVRDEWALVSQPDIRLTEAEDGPPRIGIISAPGTLAGGPGVVFSLGIAHLLRTCDRWFILGGAGEIIDATQPAGPYYDEGASHKAALRRGAVHELAARLVLDYDLRAGMPVTLHVPARYAPYLQARLETFGMQVSNPTAGLNMGQKATWLKEHTR